MTFTQKFYCSRLVEQNDLVSTLTLYCNQDGFLKSNVLSYFTSHASIPVLFVLKTLILSMSSLITHKFSSSSTEPTSSSLQRKRFIRFFSIIRMESKQAPVLTRRRNNLNMVLYFSDARTSIYPVETRNFRCWITQKATECWSNAVGQATFLEDLDS